MSSNTDIIKMEEEKKDQYFIFRTHTQKNTYQALQFVIFKGSYYSMLYSCTGKLDRHTTELMLC